MNNFVEIQFSDSSHFMVPMHYAATALLLAKKLARTTPKSAYVKLHISGTAAYRGAVLKWASKGYQP